MDEYWIDEGGLDGELRCALEGFCGMGSIGSVIEVFDRVISFFASRVENFG